MKFGLQKCSRHPWSSEGVTSGMEKTIHLPSQTPANSPVRDIRNNKV